MQDLARELGIALVVPLYERTISGVYYNTAVDHRRRRLGARQVSQAPYSAGRRPGRRAAGFGRSTTSSPGKLGYPAFQTTFAKHRRRTSATTATSPKARALLGLDGAEIVFNPSATVAGLSEYLWKLEQPAHAVANGYYVGAINRVGFEAPWNMGEFYGQSYLVDPRGQFVAIGSRDKDEVVIGDMDRRVIEEVRNTWQFYRDRRPETYGDMVEI